MSGYQEHPDIKTPPDDTRIWRYISLERYISGLRKGLYFSRLDHLRDPLEGRYTAVSKKLMETQLSIVGANDTTKERIISELDETVRTSMLVNCWSMSEYENALMWRSYAPEGVAITTTVGQLKKAFDGIYEKFYIGEVDYVDYTIHPTTSTNIFSAVFCKSILFRSEQELRVCVWTNEPNVSKKPIPFPKPGRYYPTSREAMSRIFVYNDMSDDTIEVLLELIRGDQPSDSVAGNVTRSDLYKSDLSISPLMYRAIDEWAKDYEAKMKAGVPGY